MIGKYGKPRCLKNVAEPPVTYRHSANAWMTKEIWRGWLEDWNKKLRREARKIALLIDNCSTHEHVDGLTQITVMRLPANTTSVLQPFDMGIIRTLKAYCRREMRLQIIERIDDLNHDQSEVSTDTPFKKVTANDIAKKLNLLEAMHTIVTFNCWKRVGFEAEGTGPTEAEPELGPPVGMTEEQFDAWVDHDLHEPTNAESTFEETEQQLINDIVRRDEVEVIDDDSDQDDGDDVEDVPSNSEMRHCLRRLCVGLESRGFQDIDNYRKVSARITDMLRANLPQKSVEDFF